MAAIRPASPNVTRYIARRYSTRCLAAAAVFLTLCSCSFVEVQKGAEPADVRSGRAKPVWEQVPGIPPDPPATKPGKGVNAVRVNSRRLNKDAVYHRTGPAVQPTIPPSENVLPGKSSIRGRGVPGPIKTEKTDGRSAVRAWSDTSASFLSTDFDDNGTYNSGFRFIPPDSHVAAGPLHLVNVVNTTISFHQKDGTLDFRDSLADFFTALTPLTFTFDPKVVYDQYNDRWLVVTLEQTEIAAGDAADTSRIFLGVSDDANPNGTWYVAEFDSRLNIGGNFNWADYPGFAVGEDAVYITANMFPFAAGSYAVRLWIIEKDDGSGGLYDGGAAGFSVHDPYALSGSEITTQPAHMYGAIPGNTDTYLASYSGLRSGTTEYIQVVRVDDPLGTPAFTQSYHAVGNIDNSNIGLADADQSGTATDIEVNDRRALNAVWIDDSLWMAMTVRPPAGANSGHTTALWLQVDTTNPASLTIADFGEIGGEDIAGGTYTYFPSIAVNGYGDAAIGFSASDDSIYAGAYFVTREAGDAAGTTGASQTVAAGTDYYIRTFGGARNRWGDYSGTVVDPVDGCFWFYNQYAQSRGTVILGEDGRWGTAVARSCNLTHACSASFNIPALTWTRFGMPCNTAPDNTVEDVFSGLAAGDYGTTWLVYRRISSTPPYYEALGLTDSLEEGDGHWVISENATTVNLNGTINTLADIELFGEGTMGRANYVGHNQDAAISWADVLFVDGGDLLTLTEADDAGAVSRQMYKWNGAAYQVFNGISPQTGSLDPFDGVWVKVYDSGLKLRIPQASAVSVASTASAGGDKARLQSQAEPVPLSESAVDRRADKKPSWHIRITAASGDLEDPGNFFGRQEGSHELEDVNDLMEPEPFGSRYLTVLFTNPRLRGADWGYTSDFRKAKKDPRGTWPFVVRASPEVSTVTLSWEGEDFLFEDAWLTDHDTGESFKVHSAESYTFSIAGGERHFTFEID